MMLFFAGDMVVKLSGFFVAYVGGVFTPVPIAVGSFLLFPDTLAEVMTNSLLLNIISRQVMVFPYLTASAFFETVEAT